jgi:hypothetical protein
MYGRRGPAGAEADAREHGDCAGELSEAGGVAEGDPAGGRPDDGFEIHEGAGTLGRDPRLSEGEQPERQQRAGERQHGEGDDRDRVVRRCGDASGEGGQGQGYERPGGELHRGDGSRLAPGQERGLEGDERGREDG